MTTPFTDSAEPASTTSLPLGMLLAGGLCTLLLAAGALQSPKYAVLALASVGGAAGLCAVAVFAPQRLADALVMIFLALITIPLDVYGGYQEHVGGWPGIRWAASDFALALMAGVAALGWVLNRTKNTVPALVLFLYGLLVVQYALASFGAIQRDLSVFELAAAVHSLAICVVVAALFRRNYYWPVVMGIAALVAVHTGFALLQFATGSPIGASWFGGSVDVLQETLETGTVLLRPRGLFDHPIVFADFLVLSLPVITAGVFTATTKWMKGALIAALGVGAAGLVLTLSRGAWVSCVFAFAVFFFLAVHARLLSRQRLGRILLRVALAAVIFAVLFGSAISQRLLNSSSGNLDVRFDLNRIALSMIAAHPFVGVGLNNFTLAMHDYDPTNVMRRFPAPVHNVYLLEAAESGVPALWLFLALFITIFNTGRQQLAVVSDATLRWLGVAVMAGLAGFLFSQVADFSYRLEPLRSIVWMLVGILFGALAPRRRAERFRESAATSE